jgi:hypothetical protein
MIAFSAGLAMAETSWRIDGSADKVRPTANDPSAKHSETTPARTMNEAFGAALLQRPSPVDFARAFGVTGSDYRGAADPSGVVSKISLTELLAEKFPSVASALPSYSKCGGLDLTMAQSIQTTAQGYTLYGLRQTCAGLCLGTVETQKKDKTVVAMTNEYEIPKTICQKMLGGR